MAKSKKSSAYTKASAGKSAARKVSAVGPGIRPLRDHVLIEPMRQDEKTASGIYLPATAEKERPEQGRVIAVGSGKINEKGERVPMEVKKGDKVLFSKYGLNELKVDGKEYLVAREEDILAILE